VHTIVTQILDPVTTHVTDSLEKFAQRLASLKTEVEIKNQCADKTSQPPSSATSDNSKFTEWNDVVSNVLSDKS
jgi:hypothetical protein